MYYNRLLTKEVKVGDLIIGNGSTLKVQTMTTTDTMDTAATVAQSIRCIESGAQLIRITAPSINEANNLLNIKRELARQGYKTPLVADIHFTPNAAEVAARIIEKVRVNPGNYVDKKKFEQIEYTDAEYIEEIERIHERFSPLVKICKEYGTAMRIGTNHGSLSDRIMSRYGDTPNGMVESAMEFLRICRFHSYHNIVLSMKSSNPMVMVNAYRMLVDKMQQEFNECYALHLGVTEAGDGEDGRIKSAIGIGTLLQEGIGDTVRVSLTEDPEFEIPVCLDLVRPYNEKLIGNTTGTKIDNSKIVHKTSSYGRRQTIDVGNIGNKHVPVVIADYMMAETIKPVDLENIGYSYNAITDKWTIADGAADYIYTANKKIPFALPGTLQVICDFNAWLLIDDFKKYHPIIQFEEILNNTINNLQWEQIQNDLHFIGIDCNSKNLDSIFEKIGNKAVLCIWSSNAEAMLDIANFADKLKDKNIANPIIICVESSASTVDEQLIAFSKVSGALLLDGLGDGIWLMNDPSKLDNHQMNGRTYLPVANNYQFINNTSFSILQATRTRISKTEYISCPSCGRTLFDLQETTAKIRAVTSHLKGLKIAIMGCIVNGPGEMADADFGYVGSGPGKITLYKGKEVVKKGLPSDIAVNELINLIKENNCWVDAINN